MNQRSKSAGHRFPVITVLALVVIATALISSCDNGSSGPPAPAPGPQTATPITHVVVIFQENVSFDHYFATYPSASNPPGEPGFVAAAGTPAVNSLATPLDVTNNFAPLSGVNLLTSNPTLKNTANGTNAINPFRLDRTQATTADQNHDYDAEQMAFHANKMDMFPASVGAGNTTPPQSLTPPLNTAGLVMGYYDGNTVTALWNYAQSFAMSDNFYGTTFGPSAVGAINLVSGQTNGVIATNAAAAPGGGANIDGELSNDGAGGITITGDPQPLGDACDNRDEAMLGGKNIGDLLNAANVSWGFFEGGFDLTVANPNGTTGCKRTTTSGVTGVNKVDYIPHHQPFQFYKSTQNLTHARPSSVAVIGQTNQSNGVADPANHQYDIHDFFDAVSAGNFPAVSFLKAAGYQDGHAGYSDPLDEQEFVVQIVNFLQKQPDWSTTLVIITYDDSDGWYDHQASPIVNPSTLSATAANLMSNGVSVMGLSDFLNSPGACNAGMQQGAATPVTALPGATGTANVQGRCGHGPRLPFIVVSPYAKKNYVDHTLLDQSSVIRFIEDNWLSGTRIAGSFDASAGSITNLLNLSGTGAGTTPSLFLDPSTGLPLACPTCQ